jgi:hypothetical protein
MKDVTNSVSLPPVYCYVDISLLFDSMAYFISHTVGPTDLHPSQKPHFLHILPGNSDLNRRIAVNKLQGNNKDETVA